MSIEHKRRIRVVSIEEKLIDYENYKYQMRGENIDF